jgi:hypothetical protein
MDLGVRQIRTAGKGSGSIELTLPTDLRDLVGLPCRITLRDGSRPDIVLQPDLQRAHTAFSALWQPMALLLLRDGAPFPLAAFGFGLHPRPGAGAAPFLCWRDGLLLAAPPPHESAAVSRTLGAFGHALAAPLDIAPALAAGFGAACGYLLSGNPASSDGQEACDLAAAHLPHARPPLAANAGAVDPDFWRRAAPVLAGIADLFVGWTADPSGYATLRAAWRRGRSIEMSGD